MFHSASIHSIQPLDHPLIVYSKSKGEIDELAEQGSNGSLASTSCELGQFSAVRWRQRSQIVSTHTRIWDTDSVPPDFTVNPLCRYFPVCLWHSKPHPSSHCQPPPLYVSVLSHSYKLLTNMTQTWSFFKFAVSYFEVPVASRLVSTTPLVNVGHWKAAACIFAALLPYQYCKVSQPSRWLWSSLVLVSELAYLTFTHCIIININIALNVYMLNAETLFLYCTICKALLIDVKSPILQRPTSHSILLAPRGQTGSWTDGATLNLPIFFHHFTIITGTLDIIIFFLPLFVVSVKVPLAFCLRVC